MFHELYLVSDKLHVYELYYDVLLKNIFELQTSISYSRNDCRCNLQKLYSEYLYA